MSDYERENGHNKKQKMKSAIQEEELLSQMNANLMIPKENRNPRFPDATESASRSTDLLPLQHKYIEQGGEIPSSGVVQVNKNMPQSSNIAQGRKEVATRKNKRIAIEEEEELSERKRPNLEIVEQLPKESIGDSENDPDMDMDVMILMSLMKTCLDLNSEDAIEM